MKKALLGTLVGALMLAVPALSHADTYQYVSTMGVLESETADSVAQALALPTDKAADSGVILVSPTTGIATTVATQPTGTTNTTSGTTETSMTSMTAPGTYTGSYYLPYTSPGYTVVTTNDSATSTGTIVTNTATSTENDVTLVLSTDGMATLTTSYSYVATSTTMDTMTPDMTETGTWIMENNGEIQVTLNSNSTQSTSGIQTESTPNVIVFSPNAAGTQLQAVQYNSSIYGSSEFTLTRTSS